MKTFYRLFIMLAVVCSVGMYSCTKDPDVDTDCAVQVDRNAFFPEKSGAIYDINVKANCQWTVTIPADMKRWIKATPSDGAGNGVVTIEIAANNTTEVRKAEVLIGSLNERSQQALFFTQKAGEGGGDSGEGVEMPVCAVFFNQSNDVASMGAANGTIVDDSFIFQDGITILREGGASGMEYAWQTKYYEVVLNTKGWDAQGAAWLISIPMAEELSGDLKLMFGARTSGAAPTKWTLEWSSDNQTWITPDTGEYAVSTSDRFKTLWFSIPDNKKVPEGGTLYMRLKPTDLTGVTADGIVRFDSGLVLMKAQVPTTQFPTGEKVLYTWGFDDATDGIDYILPVWYMKSAFGSNYSTMTAENGIATAGTVRMCHGAVILGTAAAAASVTIPALTKLGDYTADLKVTCKAVSYLAATGESDAKTACITIAEGPGEIDGATNGKGYMTNLNNETFESQTFYVRGATKATKIKFTNDKGRYLLDDITVEIEGEPQISDDPILKKIDEIVALKSNITASATTYKITNNYKVKGVVVSDALGANYPTTAFALVDAATANAGIRIVTTAAHALKVGEEAEVSLKDAVMSISGGILQVKVAADNKVVKTATAAVVPVPKAVTATELASGDYMSMLVSVADCQVVDGDLAKKLSGTIGMETRDKGAFSLSTLAGATFANNSAPQLSGVVKGVAGASGVVMPRGSDDLSGLVLERFGDAPMAVFTPIVGIYKTNGLTNADAVCTNGSASGAKFTFTSGPVIERVDGAEVTWGNATNIYTNFLVSKGWTAANAAYLFSLPTTDAISGEMRFSFGMICENTTAGKTAPKTWMVEWSADATSWTLVDALYTPSDSYAVPTATQGTFDLSTSNTYKMAVFTVPASQKIPAGGKIYLRVKPVDTSTAVSGTVSDNGTVRIQVGFYLAANVRGMYNTTKLPAVGGNVLVAEGFDDGVRAHDYMLGLDHMSSQSSYAYEPPTGWTAANTTIRPGYLFFTKSGGGGTLTTAPLTALGTTPTPITVKFKACLYQAATLVNDNGKITVTADGVNYDADVSSLESDPFAWHEITVTIPNATQATTVKILAAAGRLFFDDLVITK